MGQMSCKAVCSEVPATIKTNPDVTGVGVSIAYTATAGLALCVVIAYYLLAYLPDVDPFESQSSEPQPESLFRTNPIDEYFLYWRLNKKKSATPEGQLDTSRAESRKRRMRTALLQCVLTMSDFQLITGLSILISGYSQLCGGISVYHWDRIIDLAWFSSITHLCCLTFLRDYFCRNRKAQLWRLPGMVLLVIMLGIALMPSAQYAADLSEYEYYLDTDSGRFKHRVPGYKVSMDYALCSFGKRMMTDQWRDYVHYQANGMRAQKQRAILSAFVLVFGMLNRLWRLHKVPTNAFLRKRRWISLQSRIVLQYLFDRTRPSTVIAFLAGIFIYCPILAIFLTLRVLSDFVTSKAFEVWWLIVGFVWGTLRLYIYKLWRVDSAAESEDAEWTFGQVMALLLLVAPIITLIEGWSDTHLEPHDQQTPRFRSSIAELDPISHIPIHQQQSPLILSSHDPEFDFYRDSGSFAVLIYVFMATICAMTAVTLVWMGYTNQGPLDMALSTGGFTSPLVLLYLLMGTLISLSITQPVPQSRGKRVAARFGFSVLFAGCFAPGILFTEFGYYDVAACYCLHVVLSILDACLNRFRLPDLGGIGSQQDSMMLMPLPISTTTPISTSNTSRVQAPSWMTHRSSLDLSAIDALRRHDTEADIGVRSPRKRWTFQL